MQKIGREPRGQKNLANKLRASGRRRGGFVFFSIDARRGAGQDRRAKPRKNPRFAPPAALFSGRKDQRRREERIGPRAGNAREKGGLLEKTGQKSQRGGYAFDKTISRRDESNRRKTNRASVYRPPCAANKKTCRSQKRAVGLAINRRSIIPM